MSRLHDMGGRFGDGLIPLPRDAENEVTNFEPTFKYKWHAKAWAITLAAGAFGAGASSRGAFSAADAAAGLR